MLFYRLMQLIKDNWERIVEASIGVIQQDEELPNLRKLPSSALRERIGSVLKGLSSWPAARKDNELAGLCKELGGFCFQHSVMLHEVLRGLHILKSKLVDFTRSHGFGATLEVYAQEELEHRISSFFDWLLYGVVQGYEQGQAAQCGATDKVASRK